ncbi:MAG: site-2 protease family protein [Planctomycetota bacterium]
MEGAPTSPENARLLILAGVALGWLVSLMVHEWAHSIVAFHGGDRGVEERGYLSWNPLKFLHPVWSVVFPMVVLFLGGIALPGAAVYIDREALRSRAWDSSVSLAGPLSNLLLGLALGVAFRFVIRGMDPDHPSIAAVVLCTLVFLQFMACILNLIPLPPLDGWQAIRPWLPHETQAAGDRLSILGIVVILSSCSIPALRRAIFAFIMFFVVDVLGIDPRLFSDYLSAGFNGLGIF